MLAETGKHISMTERRAMTAERDSTDRYVAAYLADRLGAEFEGRVSGVAKFGFFVRLDETGADGLVPASMMGDDFYRYDAEAQILEGARSGKVFRIGMAVTVRLREAAPLTGGLIFELLGARGDGGGRPRRGGKARAPVAKKARKGAIRKANAGRKARRPQ